jgi:SAM-dependent methyltransferase
MGEVKRVTAADATANLFDRLVFYRCLKAYDFAKPFITAHRVLEIGCGTGYGLDFFDQAYAQYVGMDIDSQLLSGLADRYRNFPSPVSFLCADVNRNPLRDQSFDVIIAFQVIEHLPDPPGFFQQAKRVLRAGGHLLLTTPNRAVRLLPLQKPWNPEHVREYSYRGFRRLLRKHFSAFRLLSVSGDPFSFELERHRVKQDPFEVYLHRPLSGIARRVLPGRVRAALRQYNLKPAAGSRRSATALVQDGVDIALNNFCVGDGDSPRCLDLLAVITI